MRIYLGRTEQSLAAAYDWLYSARKQTWLEHFLVKISVFGFLAHLLLVFLARTISHPDPLIASVGRNYLSAIYTPFSLILFYEALMLIEALPKSTTQSIAKQFEIVSLIFIRKFFKGIAQLNDIGELATLSPEAWSMILDVGAGLLMFLLVTVFLHAARKHPKRDQTLPDESEELARFIARKKLIALGLTATLLVLAAYNLFAFFSQVLSHANLSTGPEAEAITFFFTDLFAVMIFTDVLIVILSLVVSDSYELVFRNEAFVISTIMLRLSLTVERPYAAILAVSSMAFGIVTVWIHGYHKQIRQ